MTDECAHEGLGRFAVDICHDCGAHVPTSDGWDEAYETTALGPYRGGKVHVLAERCSTCVFRPGNLMTLSDGRLRDLIDQNLKADAALVCHKTLPYAEGDVLPAICRGFFDAYETTPLYYAKKCHVIEEDPCPT